MEYHRIGALKGLVKDADGTSTLLDVYDTFGMTQVTVFFNTALPNSAADPKENSVKLKRQMRTALGGRGFTRVRVICSEGFFDKLVGHNSMKAAWDRWNNGQFLREDQSNADFVFADVVFQVYSGGTNSGDFIEDGNLSGILDTKANAEVQLRLTSSAANTYKVWYELIDPIKG